MVTWTKADLRAHEMKAAKHIDHSIADFTPRRTTDEFKLNKLERTYLEELRRFPGIKTIHVQSITLKLGDDCRYTPDFAYTNLDGRFVFVEVKGFMRDDARVKLLAAARMFREFDFQLVRHDKDGWSIDEVKP